MHLMHNIFREHLDDFIIIFLDDILVYSRGLREHMVHVRQTLAILTETLVVCQGLQMYIFSTSCRILGSCG